MDDDSSNPGLKITSDIVIKSDDTYSVKAVMTDNSGFGIFSEDNCKVDDFSQTKFGKNSKNAKATFKEDGDSTICTIEGSASIKDSDGTIKHQGSEYVVKIGTDEAIGDMDQLDVTQTITFPGKVTEADGGKVEGNKVAVSCGSARFSLAAMAADDYPALPAMPAGPRQVDAVVLTALLQGDVGDAQGHLQVAAGAPGRRFPQRTRRVGALKTAR